MRASLKTLAAAAIGAAAISCADATAPRIDFDPASGTFSTAAVGVPNVRVGVQLNPGTVKQGSNFRIRAFAVNNGDTPVTIGVPMCALSSRGARVGHSIGIHCLAVGPHMVQVMPGDTVEQVEEWITTIGVGQHRMDILVLFQPDTTWVPVTLRVTP
jgi:hypothetical protein